MVTYNHEILMIAFLMITDFIAQKYLLGASTKFKISKLQSDCSKSSIE